MKVPSVVENGPKETSIVPKGVAVQLHDTGHSGTAQH